MRKIKLAGFIFFKYSTIKKFSFSQKIATNSSKSLMSSNISLPIIKPITESFLIPLLFLNIYVIKINLIWLWGNFSWWQHSNKCISHHVINSNNWHLYSLKANVFGFVVTIVINQLKTWIWINIGLDKKKTLSHLLLLFWLDR